MKDEFKRASWLELFYDVAFIALVAQLTYLAAAYHSTTYDILNIVIIGYMIFIAWWATTANRNLQLNETSFDKLIIQIQMVAVFFMSVSMAGVFEGDYLQFFITLGLVRLLQSMMIVRLYIVHPETRPKTYNLLQGFIIASALWIISALLVGPWHIIIALLALAIDIFTPLTRGEGNTIRYLNVHHLQERLGLFLMLVIGESMIVVALANSAAGNMANQLGIVFSGLGLMIALWWLYFEHSDSHAGQRPNNLFLFVHSHAFLYGSIILLSVAYKLMIAGKEEQSSMIFLLLGSVGIFVSLLAIRSTLHKICNRSLVIIGGLILVALAVWVRGITSGEVYETAMVITILFTIAAKLDHHSLLGDPKPTAQKN